MDMSAVCLDYVDFRWPEGVEVFAAAHPFDDISQGELSSDPDVFANRTVSIPAGALVVPTAPDQGVLKLEFGRSYLYAALCAFQCVVLFLTHIDPLSLSVDPKFVHPSDPGAPAETPAIEFENDTSPGLHLVPQVAVFTSHAVPFHSGPGQVPGIRLFWNETAY